MIEVVCDFETCNPYLDLPTVGSTVYAQHFATEIVCLKFAMSDYPALGHWSPDVDCHRLRQLAADPEALFIAHNAGFEKDIWREIMVRQYGFPDIPNERWHDTLASAALRSWPLALEKSMPLLGRAKDSAGSRITRSLSRFGTGKRKGLLPERTPELMERVYSYCGKDVEDEAAQHARLGFLPADERRVWLLDQRINERGVRFDRAFIAGAQRVVDLARTPLAAEFAEITGGLAPTQTQKLQAWAAAQGVELPNLQKQTISDLLGEDADNEDDGMRQSDRLATLPGNVKRALAIRALVGASSIKKLPRMEQCIARDGRVYRLLQYHGTGPGRWSGRLINPLNFPRGLVRDPETGNKKPPKPDVVAEAITTGDPAAVEALGLTIEDAGAWRLANPIEVVASALRHAIVPAPGRLFTVSDFVQIQARLVLALAGQHDFLALLAAGADPYCLTAEDIYGRPHGTWTKETCPTETRQTGKNTFLGSGFEMGPGTFCQKYIPGCQCKPGTRPCEHPDSRAFQQATDGIRTYRTKTAPKVPALWRALREVSAKVVHTGRTAETYGIEYRLEDGWLTAMLLDGKKIYYWNPQPETDRFDNPSWTYQTVKNGRLITNWAYGGLLTENLAMGHERQLLVRAMFRCEQENLPVVFNSYDEIVCEPEERYAGHKVLDQILEDAPDWAKAIKVPIAAEGWVGSRYRKG